MSTARLHDRIEDDPRRGFASPRDFLVAAMADADAQARDSVADHRLRALSARGSAGELAFLLPIAYTPASLRAAAGSDEQGLYSDPHGGFGRAPQQITPFALGAVESDPTAGRTLSLPMDSPELRVLARVDKDHSTSVSGGLTVVRTAETLPRASSRMELEGVDLKATSLFGFSWATEELLGNNPRAFIAILESAYAAEFGSKVLREKLRGLGDSEFLGVLNSSAKVEVAKEGSQAADTINATNVVKMAARCWGYSQAGVWMANPDTRVEIAKAAFLVENATNAAGGVVPVFVPARSEFEPDMLHGRPCFFSEHASALGDEGDLLLVNWSQYLEGTYQPLQSAESVHVRWEEHERAFKFWLRNAGSPWWRSALTPENGANELSPIVTLAERA